MPLWVAKLFKKGQPNTPLAGYVPGMLFDPGPQRMAYVTTQHKPWYGVEGPGRRVQSQLLVSQPAAFLTGIVRQQQPLTGIGGTNAGSYPVQPLTLPPQQTSGSNTGSI